MAWKWIVNENTGRYRSSMDSNKYFMTNAGAYAWGKKNYSAFSVSRIWKQ